MKTTFLDFEQPIAELEAKVEELRYAQDDSAVDISEEIQRMQKKSQALTKEIYAKLTPWQVAQVARHPQRPYTLDYIGLIFTDFEELHGDRSFADDASIVGGLARFNGQSVMVIGHQKGRDTKEKILRNFGMPQARGLPKGAADDAACREIRYSGHHLRRYAGRISGHRRRGARPVRSHRPQSVRHGGVEGAGRVHRDRRRGIRRRTRHRSRRRRHDDAVRDLFGDFARGLRFDPLEELRKRPRRQRKSSGSRRRV